MMTDHTGVLLERKVNMTSNPMDEAKRTVRHMEAVENFLGMKGRLVGDMVHIGISDLAAALRTLKATNVIIAKEDLPDGFREALKYELMRVEQGWDKNCTREKVAKIAALVAEQLEG